MTHLVGAIAITPSDSTNLTKSVRCLYVAVTGHIALEMATGDTVTLSNVPVGMLAPPLPLTLKKVRSTGTTATGIIGFY